jgi:eukaryotic-like serine/threonine-protein kinase
MQSDRAERVAEIVERALEVAGNERTQLITELCDQDSALRAEVESLLHFQDKAQNFIETPAYECAAPSIIDAVAELRTGQIVGDYKILSLLGEGGMGEVYLAEDTARGRNVAIKLIKSGLGTGNIVRHFRNEERILAGLNHPNIARLYGGAITADGLPYFVMEYVEGLRIDHYCRDKKLSVRQRLELFRKVCAAVTYAHRHLVIHRDIKPANIRVTPDGEPKLLDFGIAKLLDPETSTVGEQTITLQALMTPNYASPEQVCGETMTTASDVYSLGVVLYELLAGQRPHRIQSRRPDEIARIITEEEPTRPSSALAQNDDADFDNRNWKLLRGDLDNILLKAIRKAPERRYQSAAQFSDDIRRHLEGLPVTARKDTFAYRATRFVGRNRLAVTSAAIILVTLVSGIVMTVREKRKADRRFNDVRRMANSFMFEADAAIQKGPTQARAMLVRQALEYLDSLAKEAGNDSGLQLELAIGYLKVGDVQGKPYRPNLGDSVDALVSYRKAQTLLQSLTATDPNNLEARRYLSIAWQSIGRLQVRAGDTIEALASQRQAVALSEALASTHPDNAPYRSLLADNYLHLGEAIYQGQRGATIADHREAITLFRKALAIHEALSAAEPTNADYRYATGVDYEYIGIAFNKLGDMTGDRENYRAALNNHRKEFRINEALAASDPTNGAYRRILADVYGELGNSQLKLHELAEALENFRHKLAIFESIRTSDPTNVEARRDVASSYHESGQALAQIGDYTAGLIAERKAVAIFQELSETEPANTETRMNLLLGLEAVSEMLGRTGEVDGALENYQKALAVLEAWLRDSPENVPILRLLAIEEANIARSHKQMAGSPKSPTNEPLAHWREAQKWYQRSLATWQQARHHGNLTRADETKVAELTGDLAKCAAASPQQ